MAESPTVLIVEDEPVVLKVAGMALAAAGITFAKATDVAGARERIATTPFKVVLTDLKLPGESGLELLRSTRELATPPEVIVITGYATTENALLSFELGAFDFIPKPFDAEELTSVTERALRFTTMARALPSAESERYSLGRHSWARLDADGSATLGADETLSGVVGELTAIDCLEVSAHAIQGKSFCELRSSDGLIHRLRAPLSGQIVATNGDLAEDFSLLDLDPFAAGWVARVIPEDLDRELSHLSQHRPQQPG